MSGQRPDTIPHHLRAGVHIHTHGCKVVPFRVEWLEHQTPDTEYNNSNNRHESVLGLFISN